MTPKPSKKSLRFPFVLLFKILLLLIFSAALFWGWHLIKNPRFMPIQKVKVQANYQHVNAQVISNIVLPYVTGQGLFSVNVEGLKQALLQQPWIYTVFIKRIWPDTLEIEITEQQAFATWNKDALLNTEGDIFAPPKKSFPTDLPELYGPEGDELLVLQQIRQWNSTLAALGLSINELNLNQRLSWQMQLNNDIIVLLGRTDVVGRFNRFVEIYPKALAPQAAKIKIIDLRYPDGLSVQWNENDARLQTGMQQMNKPPAQNLPSPG